MINLAHAQEATSAVAGSSVSGTIAQLVIIFAIFYFILIRPQQKQLKAYKEMLATIKKGDKVVTGGGIIGKVLNATETELEVEIANNTSVNVMRSTIKDVILPVAQNDNKESSKTKKKAKK